MMPEDGAGAASLSKAGGGISDKMAATNQDDNLKLEESMSQRRTTTDVINEFKISIEKLINSNLWQGELSWSCGEPQNACTRLIGT